MWRAPGWWLVPSALRAVARPRAAFPRHTLVPPAPSWTAPTVWHAVECHVEQRVEAGRGGGAATHAASWVRAGPRRCLWRSGGPRGGHAAAGGRRGAVAALRGRRCACLGGRTGEVERRRRRGWRCSCRAMQSLERTHVARLQACPRPPAHELPLPAPRPPRTMRQQRRGGSAGSSALAHCPSQRTGHQASAPTCWQQGSASTAVGARWGRAARPLGRVTARATLRAR